MSGGRRRSLSVALAVAIGGALLYLSLRNIDWAEVLRMLSGTRLRWLAPLLLLPALDIFVRALRWKLLLIPVRAASWRALFGLEAVGLGLNNILLLRVGELARAYLGGKRLGVPGLSVLSTILVERLCDAAALFTLFAAVSFAIAEVVSRQLRMAALAGVAVLLLILLGVTSVERLLERWDPWVRFEASHPRIHRLLMELVLGTGALRSPGRAAAIAGLSLLLWVCDAAIFWAAGRALGMEGLTYLKSVAVMTTAAAASALPALPGGFGNFEAGVKAVLVHFGYAPEAAIGYATLAHLSMFVVVTSIGLFFLNRFGHGLQSLGREMTTAGEEWRR